MRSRRRLILAAVLTIALPPAVASGSELPWGLEVVEVSPSVVMAQNANGSNLTCIAMEEGLSFVDAGLHTEAAEAFRKQMEVRFQRPTARLILTHGHVDHIFAMGAFADVPVVAAASERALFERQLAIEWSEQAIAGWASVFPTFAAAVETARPFMPTEWVDGERSLGPPDRRIVFATNGGHTTGSSSVWFPAEGVLVSGDLVQVDKYPYFGDPTNDLRAWIGALERWQSLAIAAICPGHGRIVDRDYLRLEREYFEELLSVMGRLVADKVPVEEAVVHPSLPAGYWDPALPEPAWWKYCLASCYRSMV